MSKSDEETEFIFDHNNLEHVQKRLSESQMKNKQVKDEKLNLVEQNNEFIAQISRQNELLELKHRQNQQQTNELNKLKEQIDDRELKLLQAVKEKQSLQNEIINSSDLLHQITSKNDSLNSEVFALRLTLEQQQQAVNYSNEELQKTTSREIKLKEQLDHANKEIKRLDAEIRKSQSELNQKESVIKQELQKKNNEIAELKRQQQTQIQQNADIIAELIEQKNQNLQTSLFGANRKPDLTEMNKEFEQLKIVNKELNQQLEATKKQLQDTRLQVQNLMNRGQELNQVAEKLTEQLKSKDREHNKMEIEMKQIKEDQDLIIANLQQQIQLLKQQELLSNNPIMKSQAQNQQNNWVNERQTKNEQIAMLQNENNQLVKLIETLKSQKIDFQGQDSQKIKHLESELKNLQSFIFDSPLVVFFNLLEDRLSKQQTKSLENKNNLKEYWEKQLKQWNGGFEELKQAFAGIKIVFSYELKYQPKQ